jgi:hypothetical protein
MVTKTNGHPFIIIIGLDRSGAGAASTVSALPKTEAASRIRTPLTEFAIKAAVLLILIFL